VPTRRDLLSQSAAVAAMLGAGLLPTRAGAQAPGYKSAAFEAKSIADAMKALGLAMPTASDDVKLTAPDIAENGAVVPVGAATSLAGVKSMLILVENNPSVLSAVFDVSSAVEANFWTRVKMGQSSNVYAVALMNDGRTLFAQKDVKVTLGGCGG
jgi:sulfur-oxidizing protein SoxY